MNPEAAVAWRVAVIFMVAIIAILLDRYLFDTTYISFMVWSAATFIAGLLMGREFSKTDELIAQMKLYREARHG